MAKKEEEKVERTKYCITAKIVDLEGGMREITGIRMIRICSQNHTLLIMEDFMPVLGEITKSVEFVRENETVTYNPIHGFYMHKQNEFFFLVESYGDDWQHEKKPILNSQGEMEHDLTEEEANG